MNTHQDKSRMTRMRKRCPVTRQGGHMFYEKGRARCPHRAESRAGGTAPCLIFLTLNSRRAALRKCLHLIESGHGGVPRESRQQCARRPAEFDGFVFGCARKQAVEKSSRITVTAADAIEYVDRKSTR